MKISVITAVYNDAENIERCILSVIKQSHCNVELIIIDGGSVDGTVEVIKKYQSKIKYWISEKDNGIYQAFNKGLKEADGEWIYFLGADDYLWDNTVFMKVEEELNKIPESVEVAYGNVNMVNAFNECVTEEGSDWATARKFFKSHMALPHQGIFIRKKYFNKYGNFDESFKISGDYELLLRGLLKNKPHYMAGIVVAGMGMGGVSGNYKNNFKTQIEARRAQVKNEITLPRPRWVWVMLKIYAASTIRNVCGETLGSKLIDEIRVISGKGRYWTKLK